MSHRALGVHELAPRGLLPVHRRGDRRQEGAGGRARQRGRQEGGPGRPRRGDRPSHRAGAVDDADAHQGQPEAGLGADGHAGALAELQRPSGARVDQQGRAAADPDRLQGQGAAVRARAAPGGRGDGVALVLPNRPEFFEITWGAQLSGLYYTAVNTHFTPDEVAYVIDDSDAKAVFVDASMADLAAYLGGSDHLHIAVGGDLTGWRSYDAAM